MLPEEEKTTTPSHYASQGPTRAENATTSIVQKPSMPVYPSIFTFVYPTPTTSPRNRSHTLGPRQHFSAYHQPLLPTPTLFFLSFLSFYFRESLTFPLPSHRAQMLQHGFVGVQEPIHAVLYTRLFLPVQAAR